MQHIGLIDVDSHNFPNLALMKISAYHKRRGDTVMWWNGFEQYDHVYVSRVFDDTYASWQDPVINAEVVHYGGTGFGFNSWLPDEMEHIYPDYSLYPKLTRNTAFGFLTRGCPNNCGNCIVPKKEGRRSRKVADLSEFWSGQKNITLLDPNMLAAREHPELLRQLADSKAWIDFTQGLDARLLTEENIALLQAVKTKMIHFAWDREKDSDIITAKLEMFKRITGIDRRRIGVYVLTNYNTSFDFDLHRVYTLRQLGIDPYVMIYNKPTAPQNVRHLARWVNNRMIWPVIERFEDYDYRIG